MPRWSKADWPCLIASLRLREDKQEGSLGRHPTRQPVSRGTTALRRGEQRRNTKHLVIPLQHASRFSNWFWIKRGNGSFTYSLAKSVLLAKEIRLFIHTATD